MPCPLCRQRQARRACPALGRDICPICCGTKRLSEIDCPATCGYLAAARSHPAAVVRRQQQRDLVFMTEILKGLTSHQKQMMWALLGFAARFGADPLMRLLDEDVADMASSMASTLQTAARGVIYEHRPRSLMAQRLATDVGVFLDQGREQGERGFDADAAAVLARIAQTFRNGVKLLDEPGPAECLATVGRVLRAAEFASRADAAETRVEPQGPSLILP